MLIPRGGTEEDRTAYTRASTLADYLDDFIHIWKWKLRYLARSLGRNPDLAALAGSEPYTTGFDKGDEKVNRQSGKNLDAIIERALDRGGISVKADYGTVVHSVTEPSNDGVADWYQNVEIDRKAFYDTVRDLGIIILGTELFTANDDLMSSGTFDHLAYVPGYGIVVTDKKTSSDVHGESFRIQLAVYAGADLYDWETDQRQTLEEYVASLGWDPALINRDKGLIFWIKEGKVVVFELDLVAGTEAAQHATWVRDNHRRGTHKRNVTAKIAQYKTALQDRILGQIQAAENAEALNHLWHLWERVWEPRHTEAAVARKHALEAEDE